jgi:hypothetical protein
MKTRRVVLALGLASVVAVAHATAGTSLMLAVPGRSNAHVSLAADGAHVVAVWAGGLPGGSTDIFAATSDDGGATFGPPVRVNGTPGDARVNGEQPPRVTVSARAGAAPLITVVWTSKRPAGSVILVAQSHDGGQTFSPALPIPGGEAAGNRGWQGVALDSRGRTRVAWLDHREMSSPGTTAPAGHRHAGHDSSSSAAHDGAVAAQRSKLYTAVVGDPSSVKALTGGVCYCCKTALAVGPDGALFLAWRHVYPGNIRDIAFAISRDRGQTFSAPARVSDDRWQLDGCPDDGPGMARAVDGRLHIVWPTLVKGADGQPTIGLFHASSSDGRTFSPRLGLPTEGVPHHPQVAGAGGGVVAAWDELASGKRRVVLGSADSAGDGVLRFTREVLSAGEPAVYPAVVSTPQGVVVGWTSGAPTASVIRLERRPLARR